MNEQTFNLDRALVAVDSKQALNKQRTQVKRTINAFTKASEATQSACQMLFENVAHCMDAEYQDKAFKLAKKNWHALAGFKNAEEFKTETGKNLSPYWSILKWGAEQPTAFYTFNELRMAYDSKPKNKVTKPKAKATATGGESDSVERAEEINVQPPQMIGLLLEEFNKCSQMSNENQQKLAVALKTLREEIHKQSQQNLKVKKVA